MIRVASLLAVALLLAQSQTPQTDKQLPIDQIKLPPGFTIQVYATGVNDARQMALGDKGTLFVGSRTARRVYAVVDRDGDKKADQVYTIANGLPDGFARRIARNTQIIMANESMSASSPIPPPDPARSKP